MAQTFQSQREENSTLRQWRFRTRYPYNYAPRPFFCVFLFFSFFLGVFCGSKSTGAS